MKKFLLLSLGLCTQLNAMQFPFDPSQLKLTPEEQRVADLLKNTITSFFEPFIQKAPTVEALIKTLKEDVEKSMQRAPIIGISVAQTLSQAIKSQLEQKFGPDALDKALIASITIEPKIAGIFIQLGASPNAKSADGDTALMLATEAGNKDLAAILIMAGADTKATDAEGKTALKRAQDIDDKEMVDLLSKPKGKIFMEQIRKGTQQMKQLQSL